MSDWIDIFLLLGVFGLIAWMVASNRAVRRKEEPESVYQGTHQRLRHAGFYPARAIWFYWIAKVAGTILAILLLLEFTTKPVGILLGGAAGFMLPDLWLRSRVKRRRNEIKRGLPFYMDLVASLLRSGLTLERSLLMGAREGFRDAHPLADEVNLVGKELQMGRNREKAFQMLYDRTGVQELKILAGAVQMGLRTGFPIEETLTTQSDQFRFQQQESAMELLNRQTAIAMTPVFLCGMPLWLVILLFPSMMELMEAFKWINPLG